MAAVSNYGSTFTFNGSSIGKCRIITPPSLEMDDAETTNHSSSGWAESIPGGLIRVGDTTIELLNESGVLSALRTSMVNKTVAAAVITNGIDTLTSAGAWIKSITPTEADATDPEANGLTIVIANTGALTVA